MKCFIRFSLVGSVIAGCAPAAHLRPMTPMLPASAGELGMGYTVVGPRPVGEDGWAHGGQAWATAQPLTWLDISLVGAFDGGIATTGLAVRWRAFEHDRIGVGMGAELGAGWAAVDLPIAIRVHDRLWMYSAPQYGTWGSLGTVRLPLGVDVGVSDELRLRGEAQLNYPDFDPYNRRVHLGMGMAFRL